MTTTSSEAHGTAVYFGLPNVTIEDLEVFADSLDPQRAASIYQEHGCLVVRGLMNPYLAEYTARYRGGERNSLLPC